MYIILLGRVKKRYGLVQDSTTQIPFPLLSGSVKGPFHTKRSNFEQTFRHAFHSQEESCCLPRQSTPLLSFTTTGRPMICFKKSLGVCFLLILKYFHCRCKTDNVQRATTLSIQDGAQLGPSTSNQPTNSRTPTNATTPEQPLPSLGI